MEYEHACTICRYEPGNYRRRGVCLTDDTMTISQSVSLCASLAADMVDTNGLFLFLCYSDDQMDMHVAIVSLVASHKRRRENTSSITLIQAPYSYLLQVVRRYKRSIIIDAGNDPSSGASRKLKHPTAPFRSFLLLDHPPAKPIPLSSSTTAQDGRCPPVSLALSVFRHGTIRHNYSYSARAC